MKANCPICKKIKEEVAPKIIGYEKSKDSRFVQQQLAAISVVMCEDCLSDYKQGKIVIKPKKQTSYT